MRITPPRESHMALLLFFFLSLRLSKSVLKSGLREKVFQATSTGTQSDGAPIEVRTFLLGGHGDCGKSKCPIENQGVRYYMRRQVKKEQKKKKASSKRFGNFSE